MGRFDMHFAMKDSASGRDPLAATAFHAFSVAKSIFIVDTPVKHVRNCFDSPMRMPLISFGIIRRTVGIECIKHEKWIKVFCIR